MTVSRRSGPRAPRLLAIITTGQGSHLLAPTTTSVARAPADASYGSLPRMLATCLRLLDSDPPRFQRAAAAWHARWCVQLPQLTLADAQVTLAAMEALTGPNPVAGAQIRRAHV